MFAVLTPTPAKKVFWLYIEFTLSVQMSKRKSSKNGWTKTDETLHGLRMCMKEDNPGRKRTLHDLRMCMKEDNPGRKRTLHDLRMCISFDEMALFPLP